MHRYDYRCQSCVQAFTLTFRSYAEFDRAEKRCPACGASGLTRVITGVAIPRSDRDFGRMSSGEMLSVLESGDESQARELLRQVGSSAPPEK